MLLKLLASKEDSKIEEREKAAQELGLMTVQMNGIKILFHKDLNADLFKLSR